MSAIEVLKEIKQELINSDKRFGYSGNPKLRYDALDEALLALEQKDNDYREKEEIKSNVFALVDEKKKLKEKLDRLKKWLEYQIKELNPINCEYSNAEYDKRLFVIEKLKEILELIK